MRSFYKWVGVNKATSAMNHLIEQQLFALEMDALTYRMQHCVYTLSVIIYCIYIYIFFFFQKKALCLGMYIFL